MSMNTKKNGRVTRYYFIHDINSTLTKAECAKFDTNPIDSMDSYPRTRNTTTTSSTTLITPPPTKKRKIAEEVQCTASNQLRVGLFKHVSHVYLMYLMYLMLSRVI